MANNISGDKKSEMITDKNGNVHIVGNYVFDTLKISSEVRESGGVVLVGNMRSGKTVAMQDLTDRIKSFSSMISQAGFTIA